MKQKGNVQQVITQGIYWLKYKIFMQIILNSAHVKGKIFI